MTYWEYETVELRGTFLTGRIDPAKVQATLSRMGAQGWELASTVSVGLAYQSAAILLIFKRRAVSEEGTWPPPARGAA